MLFAPGSVKVRAMFFKWSTNRVLSCCISALLFVVSAGCATSRNGSGLILGNATDSAIQVAEVVDGSKSYAFADIQPYGVSGSVRRKDALSQQLTVRWGSGSSTTAVQLVTVPERLRDYEGLLQLQIDSDGAVKLFAMPLKKKRESVLPWGLPANWEGTPAIPGLDQ